MESSNKAKIAIAIDLGSSRTSGAFQITAPDGSRVPAYSIGFTHPFMSPNKRMIDIPSSVVRTPRGYIFGVEAEIARYHGMEDKVLFPNLKHCLTFMDREAATQLETCFNLVYELWEKREFIMHIYAALFKHVLHLVETEVVSSPQFTAMFQEVPWEQFEKELWVMYPLQHNVSFRGSVIQAGLEAGYRNVHTLPELFAVGTRVGKSLRNERPGVFLILDLGDLTVGAAVIEATKSELTKVDRISHIIPPETILEGNKSINDRALGWFNQDTVFKGMESVWNWINLANIVEDLKKNQKRIFKDGRCLIDLGKAGNMILTEADMFRFSRPHIIAVADLACKQYNLAVQEGFTPTHLAVCGGPVHNEFFTARLCNLIKGRIRNEHGKEISCNVIKGYMSHGALEYAVQLIKDPSVATTLDEWQGGQ
ncbi:hypothetical protein BJY04DRAFT_217185 [Aspergillus karnatakaensis]|uniref:uncharacterized protein n=1 Tax=Aspergillus karnatakaensis TaxID=1810916 RepID=UPI003CCDEF6C